MLLIGEGSEASCGILGWRMGSLEFIIRFLVNCE